MKAPIYLKKGLFGAIFHHYETKIATIWLIFKMFKKVSSGLYFHPLGEIKPQITIKC